MTQCCVKPTIQHGSGRYTQAHACQQVQRRLPCTMGMHIDACTQICEDASAVLLPALHCLSGGTVLNMSCHPDLSTVIVTAETALVLKVAAASQPVCHHNMCKTAVNLQHCCGELRSNSSAAVTCSFFAQTCLCDCQNRLNVTGSTCNPGTA